MEEPTKEAKRGAIGIYKPTEQDKAWAKACKESSKKQKPSDELKHLERRVAFWRERYENAAPDYERLRQIYWKTQDGLESAQKENKKLKKIVAVLDVVTVVLAAAFLFAVLWW